MNYFLEDDHVQAIKDWTYNNIEDLTYALKNLNLQNKRILSLGCGTGKWEQLIKKLYPSCQITGVDINEKAIMEARDSVKEVSFILADFYDLDSNFLSQFDVILWIPGPYQAEFVSFVTEYFLVLKDRQIDVYIWPCLFDYDIFILRRYREFVKSQSLDINDYSFKEAMRNIKKLVVIASDKEYEIMISSISESLCKMDRAYRFIHLYDFDNKDLEEHLKSQMKVLEII